jgi:hypothetical protein
MGACDACTSPGTTLVRDDALTVGFLMIFAASGSSNVFRVQRVLGLVLAPGLCVAGLITVSTSGADLNYPYRLRIDDGAWQYTLVEK